MKYILSSFRLLGGSVRSGRHGCGQSLSLYVVFQSQFDVAGSRADCLWSVRCRSHCHLQAQLGWHPSRPASCSPPTDHCHGTALDVTHVHLVGRDRTRLVFVLSMVMPGFTTYRVVFTQSAYLYGLQNCCFC